jgi:long-subunit acyl-CoA synthetase (AMP-forming)
MVITLVTKSWLGLTSRSESKGTALKGYQKGSDEVAVLMLTSGSTGNAKAVVLTN